MNFRRLIGALAILAGLLLPLAATAARAGEVLDRIKSTGVLRAPFPDVWPPHVVRKPDGSIDGFDVEVLREIGRRVGVKVEYVNNPDGSVITWEEQTSGQWQRKYDIVVGGMAPTAKRAEHLAFPVAYRYGMGALAVNRNNTDVRSPADASHKRIGVLKESIHEKYLKRVDFGILGLPAITYKIDDPVVVAFDHEENVIDALSKNDGTIEATVNSIVVLLALIKQGKPLKIIGQVLYKTPVCIAILPGDEEFAAILKGAVEHMRADGTLSRLAMKWYEFDLTQD